MRTWSSPPLRRNAGMRANAAVTRDEYCAGDML